MTDQVDEAYQQLQEHRANFTASAVPTIAPSTTDERSKNPLRPARLADVVGQERAKIMMARAIQSCQSRDRVLPHVLMVGPSGTGKSTFSHVIAAELGVRVFELEAPISTDQLLELRETMDPGDILKIEEIHQQAIMERRGRSASTQPEVLYAVMEDRVLPTGRGVLPFPEITLIGTTTDEGMLPDAFINRFPLRPRLEPYDEAQLADIATYNAQALGCTIAPAASEVFAKACRGVPRQINNYVVNAITLWPASTHIDTTVAHGVLFINEVTPDGMTADMQAMLAFLFKRARQKNSDGEIKYQASVNTIATAIGKSRDSKAIALRVEPYLIEKGWVQVTHGGRRLTDAGIKRARKL